MKSFLQDDNNYLKSEKKVLSNNFLIFIDLQRGGGAWIHGKNGKIPPEPFQVNKMFSLKNGIKYNKQRI